MRVSLVRAYNALKLCIFRLLGRRHGEYRGAPWALIPYDFRVEWLQKVNESTKTIDPKGTMLVVLLYRRRKKDKEASR